MVKEKTRENTYTWCCEKRKSENCKGRATTNFSNGLHYLKKFNDHNHSPRWGTLVGQAHVGLYAIIQEFQKEQQQVEIQVENILSAQNKEKFN